MKRPIATLALCTAACGDSPTAPTREITLYFCGVAWAAYQNDGEAWESLPSVPREVTFRATDRLAIATVSGVGGPFSAPVLDIHYLTTEQAEATFICGAPTVAPPVTKQLLGSVAGVSADATAHVSTGRGIATATAASPTFQVTAVRDGPADLLATHHLASPTPLAGRADRIIVRRGESHADGTTMPVLDFSSSEAFAPQSNTLTMQGMSAGASLTVLTEIVTQRGASDVLKYDFNQSSAVVTTHSLPADRLADGDLHHAVADAGDRSILFFYRAPSDRTLALGPLASAPTFTRPTGSPDVLRIDVPSQLEYPSEVRIIFAQPQPSTSNNTVRIAATREYFGGTPETWSLALPNLTGVPGYSPLWGLSPGGNGWTLTVTDIPHGASPASARDGDVHRSATASGGFNFVP